MIVIMLIPVALAIAAGFEPMKWTVTYSWGNSIITSEVKSFTVNPLIIFLGALVYGLSGTTWPFARRPRYHFYISSSFLTSFRYITGRRI